MLNFLYFYSFFFDSSQVTITPCLYHSVPVKWQTLSYKSKAGFEECRCSEDGTPCSVWLWDSLQLMGREQPLNDSHDRNTLAAGCQVIQMWSECLNSSNGDTFKTTWATSVALVPGWLEPQAYPPAKKCETPPDLCKMHLCATFDSFYKTCNHCSEQVPFTCFLVEGKRCKHSSAGWNSKCHLDPALWVFL